MKDNEFKGVRVRPFENNTFHCSKNNSFVSKEKLNCQEMMRSSLKKKKLVKENSNSFKIDISENKSSHLPEAINFVEPYALNQ